MGVEGPQVPQCQSGSMGRNFAPFAYWRNASCEDFPGGWMSVSVCGGGGKCGDGDWGGAKTYKVVLGALWGLAGLVLPPPFRYHPPPSGSQSQTCFSATLIPAPAVFFLSPNPPCANLAACGRPPLASCVDSTSVCLAHTALVPIVLSLRQPAKLAHRRPYPHLLGLRRLHPSPPPLRYRPFADSSLIQKCIKIASESTLGPVGWCFPGSGYCAEDDHFIIWMRTAAMPTFRKLYGVISTDLEPGVYTVEIANGILDEDSGAGLAGLHIV